MFAPLLGVLAPLLDDIASDYVSGEMNTIGRSEGCSSLCAIWTMDGDKDLSSPQHHR